MKAPSKAFTLIELLVVLAILGLLTALTVPAIQSVMRRSQQTASMSNLRQLVAANLTYAVENGHFAPADDQWNTGRWHGQRNSPAEPFDPARGFLAEHLGKSGRVKRCPLFRDQLTGSRSFEDGTGGYGYNSSYIGGRPGRGYGPDGRRIAARPSEIVHPRTVMFASSGYATGDTIQEYAYIEPPFWDFGDGPVPFRPSPTTHFRFGGRAAVGWVDGSVTLEKNRPQAMGHNPHGGDASRQQLGWFGPDEQNGYWNPGRSIDRD